MLYSRLKVDSVFHEGWAVLVQKSVGYNDARS